MSYRQRYRRSSTNSLLRRLVNHVAPTESQIVRILKQQSRGGADQRRQFYEAIERRFPQRFNDMQKSYLFGRGGYWGNRIGSYLGGLVGNATFGGRLGSAIGDAVGSVVPYGNQIAAAAEHVAKLTGHGAYDVAAPEEAMQVATFQRNDVDCVNIKSREYLGAISGSSAFVLKTLIINPGLLSTFPQLSKLAMHYQQYLIKGLVFTFHSTSGESTNSADTAIGEVLMANQPDSTEADPLNKQQMVALDGSKQAKPSVEQLHGIECAPGFSSIKYIRHGDAIEASQDAQRFDMGKFHIATEGMNAAVTRIGELWVSYDIDLIRSRDSKGQEVAAASFAFPGSAQNNLFAGVNANTRYNSLGMTYSQNTLTWPTFINDGDYQVTLGFVGVGALLTYTSPNILSSANCTVASAYTPAATQGVVAQSTNVSSYIIRINAPGSAQASITFNVNSIWPGNTTTGYLTVNVKRVPQYNLTSDWV